MNEAKEMNLYRFVQEFDRLKKKTLQVLSIMSAKLRMNVDGRSDGCKQHRLNHSYRDRQRYEEGCVKNVI